MVGDLLLVAFGELFAAAGGSVGGVDENVGSVDQNLYGRFSLEPVEVKLLLALAQGAAYGAGELEVGHFGSFEPVGVLAQVDVALAVSLRQHCEPAACLWAGPSAQLELGLVRNEDVHGLDVGLFAGQRQQLVADAVALLELEVGLLRELHLVQIVAHESHGRDQVLGAESLDAQLVVLMGGLGSLEDHVEADLFLLVVDVQRKRTEKGSLVAVDSHQL